MQEFTANKVKKQFIEKLKKFNAPTDDVDVILEEALKVCKHEFALSAWLSKIYFRRHPDIAEQIHIEWHRR